MGFAPGDAVTSVLDRGLDQEDMLKRTSAASNVSNDSAEEFTITGWMARNATSNVPLTRIDARVLFWPLLRSQDWRICPGKSCTMATAF